MDVHPPHQPIRGWKDFLLHLLTITVGLCIALALEAAVESIHHRHIVREAHENLRREIEKNHALYAENARSLKLNRERLKRDIDQLRDLRDGRKRGNPDPNTELSWAWEWNSFEDSAWRSAHDIGAILYMDTDAVGRYSDVYLQQGYVNATAISITADETKAGAPLHITKDPGKLLPGEIEAMLIATGELDLRIGTLESTMRSLDGFYSTALTNR